MAEGSLFYFVVPEWAGAVVFPRFDPRSGWHADVVSRQLPIRDLNDTRWPEAGVEGKFALNTGSGFQ
jgi:hypothetical protein